MTAPWWTVLPSLGALVAVFVLAGLAVGWWIVIAIFVPSLLFVSVVAVYARRHLAKPS